MYLHGPTSQKSAFHVYGMDFELMISITSLNKTVKEKHTHTHLFSGPFSGTTRVSRYQKSETDLDFTEARDSEWQWNQLGRMQVCKSLQTDNHASTPPLSFLQAGRPSCRPTNSVKALKVMVFICCNLQRRSWTLLLCHSITVIQ